MKYQILSIYDELKSYVNEKVVLLYSGGLDSMYVAHRLSKMGFQVYGFLADVGQPITEEIRHGAAALSIILEYRDLREPLCNEFISKGILANALYNGNFPISSSYTRPLLCAEATKFAHKIGSRIIVHSATPFQNSAARFNLSIMALDPSIVIFCPSIGEFVPREEKIRRLTADGLPLPRAKSMYSIDENLWARVVENDSLEKPWLDIPETEVFEWTISNRSNQMEPVTISLDFENGLPVALNGERLSLRNMIQELNTLVGGYGIGRFVGLEDGLFGVKNPEIREAPAATILHQSHLLFEEMILTTDELRVKKNIDDEWTRLVVLGGWYTPLKRALDSAIKVMNEDITGSIRWRISQGQALCVARESPFALYASKFGDFVNEFRPFTLRSYYTQLARLQRIPFSHIDDFSGGMYGGDC